MYKLRKDETEVMQHQLDEEKKVLAALDGRYRDSLATIDDTIAKLMGRADADLPHVIHQLKYQQALRAQVEATINLLHSNVFDDMSKHLNQSYEDGFVGAVYSMHKQDVPLIMPIDPMQMVQAVQLDSKIKEGLHDSLNADAVRLKKTIRHEISRGIASGMLYPEISRNIHNAAGIPLRRAKMIVRTEAGRIQEKARADAAEKAKEQGADVVKQWCAVLDGKTRESHRMVDGQIRELEERFSNGLMFPKEAGGPAKEVINCRCTHLIRAKWALDENELKQLQERAKAFGLDKTEDINDFRNRYMKAAETVENTGKSGIINRGSTSTGSSKSSAENVVFSADGDRLYEIKLSREKKKAIIERGTSEETPVFAMDTAQNKFASYVKFVPAKEGFYDVALHGRDTSVEFFGTNIDAYTLSQIIRQRKDYKHGTAVRLLSCDTGNTDNTGDCVAQIVANELGVIVEAPTDILYVSPTGAITIGDRNTGKMETFYPRK